MKTDLLCAPNVWRLNIKTAASEGINPRKFCIDKRILGVGWPVDAGEEIGWPEYYELAMRCYYEGERDGGWWPAVNAIKNHMQINDLCWTRSDGIYYLGRVLSDWAYQTAAEYKNADVVNIRGCDWKKIGEVDAVPGKVINSFIPSRTVQRVVDVSVQLYSQFLYNSKSTQDFYHLRKASTNLFALISSEDCEDIVGLYLQEKGYRIIPSSCKADTATYEFKMKHSVDGHGAVTQVKQGPSAELNISDYSSLESLVYLMSTAGRYSGDPANNVVCLDPAELRKFAYSNRKIMSDRVRTWMSLAEQLAET